MVISSSLLTRSAPSPVVLVNCHWTVWFANADASNGMIAEPTSPISLMHVCDVT